MDFAEAPPKHPLCLGEIKDSPDGIIVECGYHTVIQCAECSYRDPKPVTYLTRRRRPDAKGNQINGGNSEQLTLFPREPYGNE
jgi:hypothetical protein